MTQYKIGQWVRFYRAATLMITEIRYILPRTSGDIDVTYATDNGYVTHGEILEAR